MAEIDKIKAEMPSCLIVSGWAKADSAWIKNNILNPNNYYTHYDGSDLDELVLSNDAARKDRKFEIRLEIDYTYGTTVSTTKISCSYDWMNTNWQYCSASLWLYSSNIEKITGIRIVFDYSKNYGDCSFFGMELNYGSAEENRYDENKLLSYYKSTTSIFYKGYNYDKNNNLISLIESGPLPNEEEDTEFATFNYYTPNGVLVKSIDYNNIVTEYEYDENGNVVKEMTYHQDNGATKYVAENVYSDDSKKVTAIDQFGQATSVSEYDKFGNLIVSRDFKGNSISYGYDVITGEVNSIASSSCGEVSENVQKYTLGLLTETLHNGSVINYKYDHKGRIIEIKVNNQLYCSIEYVNRNTQITTYANGEKVKKVVSNDNNHVDIYYAKNGENFSNTVYEISNSKLSSTSSNKIWQTVVEDCTNGNDEVKYKTTYNNKDLVSKFEISGDDYGKKLAVEYSYGYEDTLTKVKTFIAGSTVNTENRTYESTHNGKLLTIEHDNCYSENLNYDKLARISKVTKTIGNNSLSKQFAYLQKGERTSDMLASESFGVNGIAKEKLSYSYDANGNIIEVRNNGLLVVRYEYDELNRLIREDNRELGKSFFTSYDSAGNITQRKECDFTLDYFDNLEKNVVGEYEYADSGNKDRLLFFNGEECLYDSLGRPSTYRGNDVEWTHVNRLAEINGATFKYNYQGVRLFKTFGDKTTKFYYDGTKLLCQENETDNLYFFYGTEGVTAFKYNGNVYHYKKDMLGNILGIYDENNCLIAKYVYDAWGNHKTFALNNNEWVDISIQLAYNENSSLAEKLAILNPFRYRSYYFDIETGLYYLQSRYYDPQVGRFLSPDSLEYLDPETIHGLNLFAYCGNNPIMAIDPSGHIPNWLRNVLIVGAGVILIAGLAVATIYTGGAAAGLAGAIFAGALKGALIGAAIGTVAGGAIGYAIGGVDGLWTGLSIGFTGGAVIGAIIGGTVGGLNYSPLRAASNAANKAIPAKGFNINKHLSSAGGKYSKFNINSSDDIVKMVQNGLKGQNVSFAPNSSKSWKVIVDMGTQIGTKGQSAVRVIIGYGGKIWTMFPV